MVKVKTMEWPADNGLFMFENLSKSVRDALTQAYSLRRKSKKKNIIWSGPPTPQNMKTSVGEFEERLSASSLAYGEDDQGEDALDVIISIAIQLGMEQGRRFHIRNSKNFINYIRYSNRELTERIKTFDRELSKGTI